MRTAEEILAAKKDKARELYLKRVRQVQALPPMEIPKDPLEAMRLGLRLGHRKGYGEGLVDGVELGMEIGIEALEAISRQPVIVGAWARA